MSRLVAFGIALVSTVIGFVYGPLPVDWHMFRWQPAVFSYAIFFVLFVGWHYFRAQWEMFCEEEVKVQQVMGKAKDLARLMAADCLFDLMVRIQGLIPSISLLPFVIIPDYDPKADEKAQKLRAITRQFQIMYEQYLLLQSKFSLPVADDPIDPLPTPQQHGFRKEQLERALRVHTEALRAYTQKLRAELFTVEPKMQS